MRYYRYSIEKVGPSFPRFDKLLPPFPLLLLLPRSLTSFFSFEPKEPRKKKKLIINSSGEKEGKRKEEGKKKLPDILGVFGGPLRRGGVELEITKEI